MSIFNIKTTLTLDKRLVFENGYPVSVGENKANSITVDVPSAFEDFDFFFEFDCPDKKLLSPCVQCDNRELTYELPNSVLQKEGLVLVQLVAKDDNGIVFKTQKSAQSSFFVNESVCASDEVFQNNDFLSVASEKITRLESMVEQSANAALDAQNQAKGANQMVQFLTQQSETPVPEGVFLRYRGPYSQENAYISNDAFCDVFLFDRMLFITTNSAPVGTLPSDSNYFSLFATFAVDDELNETSPHPIKNSVVTKALDSKQDILSAKQLQTDCDVTTRPTAGYNNEIFNNSTARLKKIKGRSFLQFINNGNFASTSNWTASNTTLSVANNKGSLPASSVSNISLTNTTKFNLVQGHKYYIQATYQNGYDFCQACGVKFLDSSTKEELLRFEFENSQGMLSQIFESPVGTKVEVVIFAESTVGFVGTLVLSKVQLFDISATYGQGKEPTLSQMESLVQTFFSRGITDTVVTKLQSTGNNLLPAPFDNTTSTSSNGINFTIYQNGTLSLTGTNNGRADSVFVLSSNKDLFVENVPYTISTNSNDVKLKIDLLNTKTGVVTTKTSETFVAEQGQQAQTISVVVPMGTATTFSAFIVKPMINIGPTAFEFESYKTSVVDFGATYTLKGIGDIQDELDLENGRYICKITTTANGTMPLASCGSAYYNMGMPQIFYVNIPNEYSVDNWGEEAFFNGEQKTTLPVQMIATYAKDAGHQIQTNTENIEQLQKQIQQLVDSLQ